MYCIVDRRYDFDTRLEEAHLLKTQTRDGMSAFAQHLFGLSTRRLMSIQVSLEDVSSPLEDATAAQQLIVNSPNEVRGASSVVHWPSMC